MPVARLEPGDGPAELGGGDRRGCPEAVWPYLRLHAAGWSIGDTAYLARGELVWIVSGSNGENLILAEGPTRAAAWRAAVGQARAVGMVGPRPTPGG